MTQRKGTGDSSLRSRMTQRKNTMTNRRTRAALPASSLTEPKSSCLSERSPRSEESRSSRRSEAGTAIATRAIQDSASLEKGEHQQEVTANILFMTESKVVRCAQLCA